MPKNYREQSTINPFENEPSFEKLICSALTNQWLPVSQIMQRVLKRTKRKPKHPQFFNQLLDVNCQLLAKIGKIKIRFDKENNCYTYKRKYPINLKGKP